MKQEPTSLSKLGVDKLSRLDRSLTVILQNPDETPSRQAGITNQLERLQRLHGTSIIFESSLGLSLGPSTNATACTIFHRFYHSASLLEYDVWSVAMACTLLATKVEEEAKTLKHIIEQYANIYAKRVVLADLAFDIVENEHPFTNEMILSSPIVACLSQPIATWPKATQRQHICANIFPQLNTNGPVYREWNEKITHMESILLRHLGFTFYWISDSHPHKYILNFCKALELDDKQFAQRAWDYCNDSCRLDLSVRYLPEIIASSAIFLAARDFNISLPIKPCPWWEVFLGNESNIRRDLVDVANAILGVCNLHLGIEKNYKTKSCENDADNFYADWLIASKGFVRSLAKNKDEVCLEKSFNDPGSFLWFYHKDMFEKAIQNGP